MKATIGIFDPACVAPLDELGLHPAAGLGVDDDRLGLRVLLEQRHQLGVGGADDRVAADRDRGRDAEAGCGQGRGDLGGHAAGAAHHADRAGDVGLGRVLGGAADAAHLGDAGGDQAEAVGADDPGAALVRPARPSRRRRGAGSAR